MTHYKLQASFLCKGETPDDSMEDLLDKVDHHLAEVLGARGVHVVSDGESDTFVVSMLVEANAGDSPETVVGMGLGTIRTAFHAHDANTPGWEAAVPTFQGVALEALSDADIAVELLLPA